MIMNRILIDNIKNVIIDGPKKIIEADINNDYDILVVTDSGVKICETPYNPIIPELNNYNI